MSGRGLGFCAGYDEPGYLQPGPGGRSRGWAGGGGGHGRGHRHWYRATGVPGWARAGWPPVWGGLPARNVPGSAAPMPDEMTILKTQAEYLAEALEDVRKRLAELETEPEGGSTGA